MAATGRHYYTIRKRPPLDGMAEQLSGDVEARVQYERSRAALETLTRAETELRNKIQTLASQLSNQAETTALILERQERRLRLFTITTGLLAVLIGLLVTLWATMTLRPLQRLRAAARRIARGEYESRISEKGPTEVADLAREFNVMGRAVEERERELVRQERLVAVGKMAAMITHEVRNPLSAIGLNTELLEEELSEFGDTSEGRALCRAITTEVDRLTAITEEYLQFARLPKPKRQPEQVNAIIRSLVEFQREPLAQRGVELTCELDEQLPAVLVDHSQLRQALLNLLRNAAEAVADSGLGTVTLNSRQVRGGDGDAVEIAVGDSGPGVSADILPNLFDPFVSSKEGGTGLGLALTHQIIREHGGDIRVDSAPGQGATFIISLPAPGGGDR
ncbi:MAG: ATP-binding protein, partial [Myxococcota bacterium]